MNHHPCKSLNLSVLFLAGLVAMVPMSGCMASSEGDWCELGEVESNASGAGEGACDEEEITEDAAALSENAASSTEPSDDDPQAWCTPFCDRI